jgi:hypothetical protein
MVEDVWDDLHLVVPEGVVLGDVKASALRQAGVTRSAEEYLVKFRGAELEDEDRTLNALGVGANASLIILSRRRRPVR